MFHRPYDNQGEMMDSTYLVRELVSLKESGPGHSDPHEETPQAWRDGVMAAIEVVRESLSAPPVAPSVKLWCSYCGGEHDVADCDDYNNEPTTDDLAESGEMTE
jgi:hypothetical protein